MKRVEANITIQADIHLVWEAMVNTQQYPRWNPFVTFVKTETDPPTVGTEMEFTVCWQNGKSRKTCEVVDLFAPPSQENGELKAEWSYYFKSFLSTIGMVKATRKQILTSSGDGTTYYLTYEAFRGWGILFLPVGNIQDGFDRQAKALKDYCEGLSSKNNG